jgi:cytochrome c5
MASVATAILSIGIYSACNTNTAYRPPTVKFSLDEQQIPAYEKNIDHKAIIRSLDSPQNNSLKRGERIYNNICITCHGTPAQEGSVPTAFKFWKDKFKVGKDPYAMYLTLTRGYGGMPPHPSLTPVEKYEVIHFIREEYLRKQNPQELFKINESYLASIPIGNTKGPLPKERKPWAEMDYGNFLINTYEVVPADAPAREISRGPAPLKDENLIYANFAYKGIAVRLDEGQGGIAAGNAWMIFELAEGKNREIRRVCEAMGLQVNRLIRIGYGAFELDKLAVSAIEEVGPGELRKVLGSALAGAPLKLGGRPAT